MTLVVASSNEAAILLATDSHRGIINGEPDEGEKTVVWLRGSLALTGYGDFRPHPLGLRELPGLEGRLASARDHSERSAIVVASLQRAHRSLEERSAMCLLFGFEGSTPMLSRIASRPAEPFWALEDTITAPRCVAGRLEALGYSPDVDFATTRAEFPSERAFWAWAARQMEAAANWTAQRDGIATVRLPMRVYRLQPIE